MKCTYCNGTGEVESTKKSVLVELFENLLITLETPRTKMTTGRLNKLRLRLKTFDADEIHQAALNLSRSGWHMGDNPNNVKYASVDFLLRNDEKIDEWLNKQVVVQEPIRKFA